MLSGSSDRKFSTRAQKITPGYYQRLLFRFLVILSLTGVSLWYVYLFRWVPSSSSSSSTSSSSFTNPPLLSSSSSSPIQTQQLIFSINSGRVGTGYLASILATAENITAKHEPEPVMVGHYLRLVEDQPLQASFKERSIKATAVAAELALLPPTGTYAESNPNFIKTFYDVILETFSHLPIKVVVLRRPLPEVLKSLIELGHFRIGETGNPAAANWIPSPYAVTRAHPPCVDFSTPGKTDEDQYWHLIWYLIDLEARTQRFREEVKNQKNVAIVEVTLNQLTQIEGVLSFFEKLNLTPTSKTHQLVGKKVNQRTHVKNRYGSNATIPYCREMILKYTEQCRENEIPIPPLMMEE